MSQPIDNTMVMRGEAPDGSPSVTGPRPYTSDFRHEWQKSSGAEHLVAALLRGTGSLSGPTAPAAYRDIGGPLTGALIRSLLLGGLGWFGGRYAAPRLLEASGLAVNPRRAGALGATIGTLLGAVPGIPNMVYNVKKYGWPKINLDPGEFMQKQNMAEDDEAPDPTSSWYLQTGAMGPLTRTFLPSGEAYGAPVDLPSSRSNIAVSEWKQRINSDPYLSPFSKAKAKYILDHSELGSSGLASGMDVMKTTALHGLAGLGGAALLGRFMGAASDMPTAKRKRLWTVGAMAGALHGYLSAKR